MLLAVGSRSGESVTVVSYPSVNDVLSLTDDGQTVCPEKYRHPQRPRQRRVDGAGAAIPATVGGDGPRCLLTLLDSEAGSLGRARLLKRNGRHAAVAVEGLDPPDRTRSEASVSVED